MQYAWERKVSLVLEHLHKETTPEKILELMVSAGVFTVTEDEKKIILSCVYASSNHIYFGGTWDPKGMMNKSPKDSLREIKETLDKLVADGTLTKDFRDRRWKQILDECNRPENPSVEYHKREFERIEFLLKAAENGGSQ